MEPIDKLNLRLLVALGLSPETAQIVMERITESEKANTVLKAELEIITNHRDRLDRWKNEMLEVESWWKKIDDFVRQSGDAILGRSVAAEALRLLKEGKELREAVKMLARGIQ